MWSSHPCRVKPAQLCLIAYGAFLCLALGTNLKPAFFCQALGIWHSCDSVLMPWLSAGFTSFSPARSLRLALLHLASSSCSYLQQVVCQCSWAWSKIRRRPVSSHVRPLDVEVFLGNYSHGRGLLCWSMRCRPDSRKLETGRRQQRNCVSIAPRLSASRSQGARKVDSNAKTRYDTRQMVGEHSRHPRHDKA